MTTANPRGPSNEDSEILNMKLKSVSKDIKLLRDSEKKVKKTRKISRTSV